MNCLPKLSLNALATARAMMSAGPPAGNGTIMVTGRSGHSCASAAEPGASASARANRQRDNRRMLVFRLTACRRAAIKLVALEKRREQVGDRDVVEVGEGNVGLALQ